MKHPNYLSALRFGGWVAAIFWLLTGSFVFGQGDTLQGVSPLANATILIIRHAEKPDQGPGLSERGVRHAAAYIPYFKKYAINSMPLSVDAIFPAADSPQSQRSRLTLEPLSAELKLPLRSQFGSEDYEELAEHLRSTYYGHNILICWHHGTIPDLIRALGGHPKQLLPDGKWPDDEYAWIIQLHYDERGNLIEANRFTEQINY